MSFYSIIHPFICQYLTQPASQLSSSLCIHPSLCLCMRSPFFIHLPVFISTQPANSSIHLSVITSIHISIHPSIRHQLHPLVIHPPIFNLHLSICPFVFQSIYPLPVHPAVLSIILPCHHSLTHSAPSSVLNLLYTGCLGYQGERLHSQCLWSADTGVYVGRKQPSCVHSHFSNQITVYRLFEDILKNPHTLHVE